MKTVTLKDIYRLILPYLQSKERYTAWRLLLGTLCLSIISVYFYVKLNGWQRRFYDALQNLNKKAFIYCCYEFVFIAAVIICIFVATRYLERIFTLHLRKFLTKRYINEWLNNINYYKLSLFQKVDNPDQRISEDIRNFSEIILTLWISLCKEVMMFITFALILWKLSGSLDISIGSGQSISVSGYIMWVALLYSVVGTYIAIKLGKPIVHLDFYQEKYEANFRYNLVRIREYSEEIALWRGDHDEKNKLFLSFTDIKDNFVDLTKKYIYLNLWQNIYSNGATIFPYLAAAPIFFAKVITLGILMQIASAFNHINNSLAIIVQNYNKIAQLMAITKRLIEFQYNLHDKAHIPMLHIEPLKDTNDVHLDIQNLDICSSNNQILLSNINFSVTKGEKILITGKSGLGKSTLIKAIAGLWPFAKGDIAVIADSMFIPQRPYMPLGTLYKSLCYPYTDLDFSHVMIKELMIDSGLEKFVEQLDHKKIWNRVLSLGEQQRVNFVRILLHKPTMIILDEPTSALNREMETKLFTTLFKYLPDITVLTIGHSESLKQFHSKEIKL